MRQPTASTGSSLVTSPSQHISGRVWKMPESNKPSILAVIPARYASTRFPGKVIAPLAGKPMVLHTYERARQASLVDDALVATDDQRVVDALAPWGVQCEMTRADHPSGTDRLAEIASRTEADILVNVQGDEPLIEPAAIDATIRPLLEDESIPMATARRRLDDPEQIRDPNVVKVVMDQRGRALYFSRWPIPYVRDAGGEDARHGYWQHIGLYVYRRRFVLEYAEMPPTPLELTEKLEQLRVLENGRPIAVVETAYDSIGVDTPEDLKRVEALLSGRERRG